MNVNDNQEGWVQCFIDLQVVVGLYGLIVMIVMLWNVEKSHMRTQHLYDGGGRFCLFVCFCFLFLFLFLLFFF